MNGIFYKDFNTSYIPEILWEIYRDRIYKPFVEGKKDLTILDCGANLGLTTQYFSQFAKNVYSVEPSKQHVEVLEHMVEHNKLDNVKVIKAAIADKDGEMTLHHNPNVTMFSLKEAVASPEHGSEQVETMRVNTLLERYDIKHVDFMKLDIEGAEMEVVGGRGFEKACEKIDSMVVEYHTWSGWNPSQLVNALRDYGYKVEQIPADATLFGATKI